MTTPAGRVVVLQGASASGKSRLLGAVARIAREKAVLPGLSIPLRYVTRAQRENESLSTENAFVSHDEFRELVRAGRLDVHWNRRVSDTIEHRYGFNLMEHVDGGAALVVLSANNYLDPQQHAMLARLRAEGRLVSVRIVAETPTRIRRLERRVPPLEGEELSASRIADVPPEKLPHADFMVPNDESHEAFAEMELTRLLSTISSSRHGDARDARPGSADGALAPDRYGTVERRAAR